MQSSRPSRTVCSQRRWLLLAILLGIAWAGVAGAETIQEFTLPTLDGDLYRISESLGQRVVIIDFWATWCKPCKKLLKRLDDIQNRFADKLEVLAISVDDASARSTVESYIRSRGYRFTVLLDPDGQVWRKFNPTVKVPFTMIIDLSGTIVYTHTGYIPGVEQEILEKAKTLFGE